MQICHRLSIVRDPEPSIGVLSLSGAWLGRPVPAAILLSDFSERHLPPFFS